MGIALAHHGVVADSAGVGLTMAQRHDRLAERAEFAGRLARAAGALANRYFNRELDFVAETKSRQDYVSVADRAVEAFIRAELSRAFPDDTMLGEETGGTVAERTWVVDPIDGTLNFVHGVHYWCVSIAWLEDGQRRIAAIYDPAPDELFIGRARQRRVLQRQRRSTSPTATRWIAH